MLRRCRFRHRRCKKVAQEGTGPLGSSSGGAGTTGAAGGARSSLTDTDLESGQVIQAVPGGHIARALGGAGPSSPLAGDGSGDRVKGVAFPAAAAGSLAVWYPTGTYAPIPGLPVGPVYRSALGRLVPGSDLVDKDWTNQIGISDGLGLEVLISPPFQWSLP